MIEGRPHLVDAPGEDPQAPRSADLLQKFLLFRALATPGAFALDGQQVAGDELAEEVRAQLSSEPERYAAYTREHLGWGVFAMMPR